MQNKQKTVYLDCAACSKSFLSNTNRNERIQTTLNLNLYVKKFLYF